ncbi:branched-subunit amino acid transport protein [Thermocatellispora tengchongensis]|uniref:Branched-subunit amino acid transport protein n=1 Tax=Thermocatellispora tengchongensis TaxID=1073253 RepID=A0A840NXB6_9ACTN|nr:AzlD domain-containing protein [Thermocatellispora tengchongensis]MBB5131852.1 branched-subunit amino acid transport protein [Thermocatellispora tengchongensis]
MNDPVMLVAAALVLGAGTFAFRFAGPVLRARMELGPRARHLMTTAAVVLLAAVVATAALIEDGGFAGYARPAGVLVGGVLAWRRTPFVVVVVAAAATTAVLRLLGVP